MGTEYRLTKDEIEAKIKKYIDSGDTESADELKAVLKSGKYKGAKKIKESLSNLEYSLIMLEGEDEVLLEGILGDKARQIWELALTKLGIDKVNVAKGLTNIFATLDHLGQDIKNIVSKYTDTDAVVSFIRGNKSLTRVLGGLTR